MSIMHIAEQSAACPKVEHAEPSLSPDARQAAFQVVAAAVEILVQGESLLRTLSVEDYTRRVPSAFNGRIGEHFRHSLEHFESLIRGVDSGSIDYDARERNPFVENDPVVALDQAAKVREAVLQLSVAELIAPVSVRSEVCYGDAGSSLTRSTLIRELVYVIAHSIHHYALMATMCRMMEKGVPDNFGIAPSTVAHRGKQAIT